MATQAVFVSRIRGLPVLDSRGDQVGKLRDVVVSIRVGGKPPLVRGFVVEIFAKRKIFVPVARIHSFTLDEVNIVGVVDTRKFVRREAELLVVDDLYDRVVTLNDGRQASLYDVSMAKSRVREWYLSEVALIESPSGNRLFGRSGNQMIVPWAEVSNCLIDSEQDIDFTVAELLDMKPADIAKELHDMEPERRTAVVAGLDDELLAEAMEELPEEEQVSVLTGLDVERAADVLEEMDPDDAADLINDLPTDMAETLLAHMEPEEAQDVRNLLRYNEYTAGGMMTPEPVILPADATVALALAKIRDPDLTPALGSMVFICRPPLDTPSGRYIGAVHFQRLLREPPSLMVSRFIDKNLEPLHPDADIAHVSRYFATYNLVVAPVVNDSDQLVGAVTVDDLVDHMLPDDWRGDQMDELSPWIDPTEEQSKAPANLTADNSLASPSNKSNNTSLQDTQNSNPQKLPKDNPEVNDGE